jgi:anti-anti-sigma factor
MTDQRRFRLTDTDDLGQSPFRTAVTADDATITVSVRRHAATDAITRSLTVVTVSGDVDRATAPLLRHALSQALLDSQPVCCDLSGVTFFGAAAANAVLAAHVCATELKRSFVLCGVRGMTGQVLAVADPGKALPRNA